MLAVLFPDLISNAPKEILAALGTLAGAFLAISYFALTWATNRMKDWEAVKSSARYGAPVQICWLAGAGILIACGLGAYLFGLLYISSVAGGFTFQWFAVGAIALKFFILARITIPYVGWYFGPSSVTRYCTEESLKRLYDPHRVLRWDIWVFLVSCGIFLADALCGRFASAFCGLLFALFGSFGVGAYCGVLCDLMPRATFHESTTEATKQTTKCEMRHDTHFSLSDDLIAMSNRDSKYHQAHSGFYLTLMSIMQGLALGNLLQVVAAEVTSQGGISPLTTFQAIASLLIIIIVWHEYAIGTVLFRWKLDFLDSAIPFLFGIVQYIMIAAISIPLGGHVVSERRFFLWLWALPVFCLISCLAYWNQYSKAVVDEDAIYLKIVSKNNLVQALGTALVFGLVAGINTIFSFQGSAQWIAAACIAAVFIGHAFRINSAYEKRMPNP